MVILREMLYQCGSRIGNSSNTTSVPKRKGKSKTPVNSVQLWNTPHEHTVFKPTPNAA